MNEEQNKKMIHRLVDEFLNGGKVESLKELLAENYVHHAPEGEVSHGHEGLIQFLGELKKGFPDLKVEPQTLIGEGDMTSVRYIMTGTHTGEFSGIPATGNEVKFSGMVLSRFANGKIAEEWELYDAALFMKQLDPDK